MRHLTLKRLREQRGWSLETASRLTGIKKSKLFEYEEYKTVPRVEDVEIILRMLGLYYIEIMVLIYDDIYVKYKRYQ